MIQIQHKLDKSLCSLEKGLNLAGYFPCISRFSGELRIGYGTCEIIGAVAAGSLLAIKALFSEHRSRELEYALEVTFQYSLHGVGNIIRGTIERIPFGGLVACLTHDLVGGRYSYLGKDETKPFNSGKVH